jgi:predicted glycoside hydrolase/deacetylase ChbG (UPF0249 family)
MKRILFRADDAGCSEGAAVAIRKTVEEGVVRNVSVMAPGPALEAAARELADLGDEVAIGLHVTLNSEWETVRWGPVLPPEQVPSLVLEDGTFTRTPRHLAQREPDFDEAIAEVAAQLARLREVGFHVRYLDEHMMVGAQIGLADRLSEFARREGLVLAARIPWLPNGHLSDFETLGAAIDEAPGEGPYVVVGHPLPDVDPIARTFTHDGMQPGEVLRERAQDRRVLTDPRWGPKLGNRYVYTISYVAAEER